ncbi:TPA: hypothetical protein DDW35_02445, partial [Candidatus Sumerlaeota bacterium]|nr:hypothetical protein [Candidatus Sumerlaeota bacterium]
MSERPDLLQTNELQLLALAVYRQLLLLMDTASIMGSGHLYHDTKRNVELCKKILGSRLLAGLERGNDERRILQRRVKEFQDLMLGDEN